MTDELTQKILAESYKDTGRLAEIINDYNQTLELRWIEDAKRGPEDVFPYVIVQNLPNGGEQAVMYLTAKEIANPPGVIARLFNSDHSKHPKGAVLARIEASERAHQIWQAKKEMDAVEERKDFWRAMWKTNKHTYKHDGKVYNL